MSGAEPSPRIELRSQSVDQLFDPFDPFPIPTRELARGAEDYIVGWVANWRPIEILLYEWWPLARRRRFFQRLAAAPVDVQPMPVGAAS